MPVVSTWLFEGAAKLRRDAGAVNGFREFLYDTQDKLDLESLRLFDRGRAALGARVVNDYPRQNTDVLGEKLDRDFLPVAFHSTRSPLQSS
jgi:hypothetical protein